MIFIFPPSYHTNKIRFFFVDLLNYYLPLRYLIQRIIFTAHKQSLGQGNIFRSVCQEFCPQGGGDIPTCIAGGIPACLAGLQAHTQGEIEGSGLGWVSRPTPRGKLRGLVWGSPDPYPGGSPGPYPGGSPGSHQGYPSMH